MGAPVFAPLSAPGGAGAAQKRQRPRGRGRHARRFHLHVAWGCRVVDLVPLALAVADHPRAVIVLVVEVLGAAGTEVQVAFLREAPELVVPELVDPPPEIGLLLQGTVARSLSCRETT
jgi:hypothetical protein